MARRGRSFLWPAVVAAFLLSIAGFWILLVPNNPVTRAFSGSIADNNGRVITGPYPSRTDFRLLRDHGVTTIVSLLDPRIPYEKVLLDRERENADKFGIKLLNFPMASILGQRMGDYYQTDAELAAKTIDSLKNDKVYLHCYLGVHRMSVVRELLTKRGVMSATYTVKEGERTRAGHEFDSALTAYHSNNLRMAVEQVNEIKHPDAPALLIRAWSYYRLNDITRAKADFYQAAALAPELGDPRNGLGYCYLRENDLDSAEHYFSHVVRADGSNPQAQAGLAMVEYRQGKFDDARQHLETSLDADSTNLDARALLLRVRSALSARAVAMK